MQIIRYDDRFNGNEWFVLGLLAAGLILVFVLPKRFPVNHAIVYFLYGIFLGKFYDHTISIPPFDFYDVNDTNQFQLMDFLSYVMFGPFSYFFLYFYDKWNIKIKYAPTYILVWTVIAIGMEMVGKWIGLYHYKNGYSSEYSFPIYLFAEGLLLFIYYQIQRREAGNQKK